MKIFSDKCLVAGDEYEMTTFANSYTCLESMNKRHIGVRNNSFKVK